MKILDWYILKRFLVTYIFTVLMLEAVLIVIDVTEKIDDFNHPDLTAWRIITEYYINFIPYYANMLSPLIIFISAVFVTSKMATHTEIVAMLSSGISLKRILRPYLIGAALIGVLVFFLLNYINPIANRGRNNFEDNFVRAKYYFTERNVHLKVAPQLYVYLESYDIVSRTGYKFTMEKVVNRNLVAKLDAPNVRWNPDKERWTIPNYKIRHFEKAGERIEKGQMMDTLLRMRPQDFESQHRLHEKLTLPELNAHIDLLRLRGADDVEIFLVEKYERMTYPFATLILTVIGVIVSARKTREGQGFQIAMGFILAFVYILLMVISRTFAYQGGIPSWLSAWIPNVVFCLIGLWMYRNVPK
ncbi:MAG: LptF/LptG family permease [Microscillaceae bacterium]